MIKKPKAKVVFYFNTVEEQNNAISIMREKLGWERMGFLNLACGPQWELDRRYKDVKLISHKGKADRDGYQNHYILQGEFEKICSNFEMAKKEIEIAIEQAPYTINKGTYIFSDVAYFDAVECMSERDFRILVEEKVKDLKKHS